MDPPHHALTTCVCVSVCVSSFYQHFDDALCPGRSLFFTFRDAFLFELQQQNQLRPLLRPQFLGFVGQLLRGWQTETGLYNCKAQSDKFCLC